MTLIIIRKINMADTEFIYNFSAEPTGTHMLLLSQVLPGSKVLDIGCAAGYLGKYLAVEKKCEVWGIESDPQSYAVAQKNNYKFLLNKNIEQALADPSLIDQKFDFILLGDVLEHLLHPEEVLRSLKNFIKPNGRLLISLPNVGHYSVRFALLQGKWDMLDSRILKPNGRLIISCPNIAYWRFRTYYLVDGDFQRIDVAKQKPWEQEHIRFFNIKILKEFLLKLNFAFSKYQGGNDIWHSSFLSKFFPNLFAHTIISEFINKK